MDLVVKTLNGSGFDDCLVRERLNSEKKSILGGLALTEQPTVLLEKTYLLPMVGFLAHQTNVSIFNILLLKIVV